MRRSALTWTTVALVMLAAVALVLAVAAITTTRGSVTPEPTASAFDNPTDQPSKNEQTGEPSDQQLEDALPHAIEPPLLMVSTSLAYRGTTGTCLGGSSLARSTDGGVRWLPVAAPQSALLSLFTVGGDAVDVIGADETCTVRVWSSTNRGKTWSSPAKPRVVFTRVPDDASRLLTPTGERRNPCPDRQTAPLAIEGISEVDAAVMCASGDVFMTQDAGLSWIERAPVDGGEAISFDGPNLGWVLQADSSTCPGYQLLQTQDAGLTWQGGGCVGDPIVDDRQLPALSFADPENGMADVGGVVFVTQDGGLTWRNAS